MDNIEIAKQHDDPTDQEENAKASRRSKTSAAEAHGSDNDQDDRPEAGDFPDREDPEVRDQQRTADGEDHHSHQNFRVVFSFVVLAAEAFEGEHAKRLPTTSGGTIEMLPGALGFPLGLFLNLF